MLTFYLKQSEKQAAGKSSFLKVFDLQNFLNYISLKPC